MRKIYILQKDLPNVPQYAIFEENDFGNYNCTGLPNLMYNKETVEGNKEWFRLKEEEVQGCYNIKFSISVRDNNSSNEGCSYNNFFYSIHKPTNEIYESIRKAIEDIINKK